MNETTAETGSTIAHGPASPGEIGECDVLVIGGGPAGTTAAALLAADGRRVVVLDKDRHPRFHIGESLLPASLPLFEKLGVADQIAAIGMPKYGVEFVSPWHERPAQLEFTDAWDKSLAYSFQVRRSDFDHILLKNARRRGATVLEGWRVRDVAFRPDFGGAVVTARDEAGGERRWHARFVLDASGRDTFLANRYKSKERNRRHASSALYAHFVDAERLPGRQEGNITIFWFEHGWFWFIPLADGATSVGAVCWPYYLKSRTGTVQQFFEDTIRMTPALAARLRGARQVTEVEATGNYSYGSTIAHGGAKGESFALVGDAFAFIDPVFSSGVFLAMSGAEMAVEAVAVCLDRPRGAPAALERYGRAIAKGPREFSWFIYRITNPAMRELFMHPRNPLRVREAVLSVLAGDLYRGTPYRPSLMAFKLFYYLNWLRQPRASLANWRRRRQLIRDPQAA